MLGNIIGTLQFCLSYLFINTDKTLPTIQTLKIIAVISKETKRISVNVVAVSGTPPS